MQNEPDIIHQPVTLEALQGAGYNERPEDSRAMAPCRKHVFWLPKRDNEQALVVRIQARITVMQGCSFATDCGMGGNVFIEELVASAAGYFQIDMPFDLKTQRLPYPHQIEVRGQCDPVAKSYDLILRNSQIAYSSKLAIVIHAHEDIDIHYTVEARPAETAD
ncbi:serine protease [Pseudomonas retamae]|uniref:Serine protease n=1 Tax=Pseudomonas retamae TaxID=702110 RepID=A0ABW7DAK5_9PSED